MTIYLYCLVPGGTEAPPGIGGLPGSPVRVVAVADGPWAWVSDLSTDDLVLPPAELARAHDAVVRAAMRLATPVPARAGQCFESDDALRRSLGARRGALVRAIEEVQGMVEMTARVVIRSVPDSTVEPVRAESGRAYLANLRDRQRRTEARREEADFLQAEIGRALRGVACSTPSPVARVEGSTLVVSHLVAAGDVERYRAAIRDWYADQPHRHVMVSGPWAPYSFAPSTNG